MESKIRAEIKEICASYDAKIAALAREITALKREVATLRASSPASAPAGAHASAPAGSGALISRSDVSAVVASTMQQTLVVATKQIKEEVTNAVLGQVSARMDMADKKIDSLSSWMAYTNDDTASMTHDYRMGVLKEERTDPRNLRRIGGVAGSQKNVIMNGVELVFSDDD